jgi:hypothetical protein
MFIKGDIIMNKLKNQKFLDGIDFLDNFITETQEAGEKPFTYATEMWNELEKIGLSPRDRVMALEQCFKMRDNR